ncbi:MAG: DUF2892 domain-containing protein [Ignavibacteriaceae bacterium]|jgi:hypothetical protein|nr:DUF2892 domain-containing protein [Ignavibacteriaceae bacterium]
MKKNVGATDKVIRVVIGLAIIGWGLYAQSWWGLIGLIPLATAATGMCGLYSLLGVNTCEVKNTEKV